MGLEKIHSEFDFAYIKFELHLGYPDRDLQEAVGNINIVCSSDRSDI